MWSILLITTFISLFPSVFPAALVPPSEDPFYDQPNNISTYAAGEVIRSRSVDPQLESLLSLPVDISVKAVSQFLFRTTDNLGDAAAAVVTLIEPHNSDPTKLLGYQTFYDSANVDCSPSYTLQAESESLVNLLAGNVSEDVPFMVGALNQGWWLYTTDYEGLKAEYTTGLQSGYAVLDSTRAVLSSGPALGLSPSPKYALWGYSGGSLASTWAAELQPSYAPELNFAGVAVGGTVPNISSILATIHDTTAAGLAFSGIYGQSKAFPNMTAWLEENLLSDMKEEFYSIAHGCLAQATAAGVGKDLYSFFRGGEAAFEMEVPKSIFRWSGQLGVHGIPSAPLFIYKAVGDEISPDADTDDLVAEYCSAGARVEYHRDLVGDHETEAISGSASALSWLNARLAGVEVDGGCIIEDVALTSLSLGSVAFFGEELYSILESVLGAEL
ncbi:hypothetical protein N7451_010536 [Penicillium sp. IBT 35674x]|nr:hypothetical protein N7451_010536 [Penicillium sp. IBT 35674x]